MYHLIRDDTLTWELNMLQCEKISYARYRPMQVPLNKLKNICKLLAQASNFNIRRIIHQPKQHIFNSRNPKQLNNISMNSLGPYVFSKSPGLPTTCFSNSRIRPTSLRRCCGSADAKAVTLIFGTIQMTEINTFVKDLIKI